MSKQAALKGVELWALAATAAAACGSLYWRSTEATLGVIVGGLLMAANLYVIRRVVADVMGDGDEAIGEDKRKKRRSWMVLQYVLKIVAILAVVGGLLKMGGISPIGLLVGITASMTALLIAGLRAAAFEEEDESRGD